MVSSHLQVPSRLGFPMKTWDFECQRKYAVLQGFLSRLVVLSCLVSSCLVSGPRIRSFCLWTSIKGWNASKCFVTSLVEYFVNLGWKLLSVFVSFLPLLVDRSQAMKLPVMKCPKFGRDASVSKEDIQWPFYSERTFAARTLRIPI